LLSDPLASGFVEQVGAGQAAVPPGRAERRELVHLVCPIATGVFSLAVQELEAAPAATVATRFVHALIATAGLARLGAPAAIAANVFLRAAVLAGLEELGTVLVGAAV